MLANIKDTSFISAKSLAVSHFSAENQIYEAQRKASDQGRRVGNVRGAYRQGHGQILARRACGAVSQCRQGHRFREAEKTSQAFKMLSKLSGSSPYPSSRIDRTKSSSRGVAKIPRRISFFASSLWHRVAVCRGFSLPQ